MAKHDPLIKAIASRLARKEARKRAETVARAGLIIGLSVLVALVLFTSHRVPLQ